MLYQQVDLTSQAFQSDPFPTYRELRAQGPVVRAKVPLIGRTGLITTYDAVNEVLRKHQLFVREAKNAGKNRFTDLQWWIMQLFRAPARNMLSMDEPDHRRLRGLVDEAFARRSVDDMRQRVEQLADEVLDQTIKSAGSTAIDFMDFSRQFPLAVICELLGLPDEDRARFTYWARSMSTVSSWRGMMGAMPNLFKIQRYLNRQIQRCRREPAPGLLSLLVEVQRSGDSLSRAELLAMAFLLLFAGHETTTHLISGGVLTLLDHPDAKADLMADWSQCESAVDEVLRYYTPVFMTKPRIVAQDLELQGCPLKRGEYLLPILASANSDPDRFAEPERFDIRRKPNPHVSFGTGIHVCLGLKLAQIEAQAAFQRILTRYPDTRLAVPREQVRWIERLGVRGLKSLPVDLSPQSSG